jgi:hypothetical protein
VLLIGRNRVERTRGGGALSYSGNRGPILVTGDPFWLL